MKRCMTWMLAVCLGSSLTYPTQGQDGLGGAAVGSAARATSRASVRVPARTNVGATARTATAAGANFNASTARVNAAAGVSAGQRTSLGANGLRADTSTRSAINADIRMRQAGRTSQGPPSAQEPADARGERQFNPNLFGGQRPSTLLRSDIDTRFNQRMAEIDRLRDAAVARGDVTLLQQADFTEQQLRAEYAQRARTDSATEFRPDAVDATGRATTQTDARLRADAGASINDARTRAQGTGEYGAQVQQSTAADADARARMAPQTGLRYAQRGQAAGQAVAREAQARGYGLVEDGRQIRGALPPANINAQQQANVNSAVQAGIPMRRNAAVDQNTELNNRFQYGPLRRTPQPQPEEPGTSTANPQESSASP